MTAVEQWLRNNGVTLASDITSAAYGVSADGNVVVGQLANGHAFIARGPVAAANPSPPAGQGTSPSPSGGGFTASAGLMDVQSFHSSLASTPRTAPQIQNGDLTLNGAHSSPLTTLLAPGRSAVWTAGDVALTGNGVLAAGSGLGEGGLAHGLANGLTMKLAVGGLASSTRLGQGGSSKSTGAYIAPEASLLLGAGVVATLSGYANWGSADIRRGYLNGTALDASFGETATRTAGVRGRVDWQDAARLGATSLSPYASVTYLTSQIDEYTESSGSFPARFDGSKEEATIGRLGSDTLTPLTDRFGLVARLEYAHRFDRNGAATTGQILGLSAFSFDGPAVRKEWARGGLGLRYRVGIGDGLIMVNTSNQTGRNLSWLSASYRVVF